MRAKHDIVETGGLFSKQDMKIRASDDSDANRINSFSGHDSLCTRTCNCKCVRVRVHAQPCVIETPRMM